MTNVKMDKKKLTEVLADGAIEVTMLRDKLAASEAKVEQLKHIITQQGHKLFDDPERPWDYCSHCGPLMSWPCPTLLALEHLDG